MLFRGMSIYEILLLLPVLFISMTLHEMAHGFAAYLMGDETAKRDGRLSLNPLHHIDWIGFLMMLTVGFGWAKPVRVNMFKFRNPKLGMAFTAFAGPLINIILAFISIIVQILLFYRGFDGTLIYTFVILMAQYNMSLAMFNLIPLPPLDGSKMIFAFLPDRIYYKLMVYERYGMIIMLILLYTNLLTPILSRGVSNLCSALYSLALLIVG